MSKPVYLKTDETRLAGAERKIRFLERRGLIPDPHPDYDPGTGGGDGMVLGWLYATLPRGSGALVDLGGGYGPDWDVATVDTVGDMTGVTLTTSALQIPAGAFFCWYGGWSSLDGWPKFTGFINAHEHGYLFNAASPLLGGGLAFGSDVHFFRAASTRTYDTEWLGATGDPTTDAMATLLVVSLAES